MTTDLLTSLLRIGGGLHFGILIASALVPQVLDWRNELKPLSIVTRQLVWTHGAFIVLTIIGLGAIALLAAPDLATGSLLARLVCGFIALFWGTRLLLQFVLFHPEALLTRWYLRAGYHALTVVFAIITVIFGYAASR